MRPRHSPTGQPRLPHAGGVLDSRPGSRSRPCASTPPSSRRARMCRIATTASGSSAHRAGRDRFLGSEAYVARPRSPGSGPRASALDPPCSASWPGAPARKPDSQSPHTCDSPPWPSTHAHRSRTATKPSGLTGRRVAWRPVRDCASGAALRSGRDTVPPAIARRPRGSESGHAVLDHTVGSRVRACGYAPRPATYARTCRTATTRSASLTSG